MTTIASFHDLDRGRRINIAIAAVSGLVAIFLLAGCHRKASSSPSNDFGSFSAVVAIKAKDGAQQSKSGVQKDKSGAQKDKSGDEKDKAVPATAYDEAITKYLPESSNRIEVMDFEAARSNQLLDVTLKGLLLQGSFGSWNHREQGIGVLRPAGIAEEAVKSLTQIRLQGCKEPVVFMRFSTAPDQRQYVQALKATSTEVGGKTCHEVRLLGAAPLHYVHFLEPTLFVFSRDPKAIAAMASGRTPPVVSSDLLKAIRMTRGGRPTAALTAKGGIDGISPSVADFFSTFTRVPGSFFDLAAKSKAIAFWYAPAERGFHTYFACLYAEEVSAIKAESKANELIQQIRQGYEADRQATVPALRNAVLHMFEQMACARSGSVVTVSWPFDA